MKPSDQEERQISPQGPSMVVEEHEGPPIDLTEWADQYIAHVLEIEGIEPRVAPPRRMSVG